MDNHVVNCGEYESMQPSIKQEFDEELPPVTTEPLDIKQEPADEDTEVISSVNHDLPENHQHGKDRQPLVEVKGEVDQGKLKYNTYERNGKHFEGMYIEFCVSHI